MSRISPTYNRQRFLLFLLEQVGHVSLNELQQLLFLSHKEIPFNYYDSIRYCDRYHSFQADSDLDALNQKGWITISENIIYLNDKPYLGEGAKKEERWQLSRWIRTYRDLSGENLAQLINERYPDNTSNGASQNNNEVFTIGYEGLSLESYLSKLIKNNINILFDIRKNPFSRKFGFSKGILSEITPKFGIEYRHISELGIISQKRKKLQSEADYFDLFCEYRENLPDKKVYLQDLIISLCEGKRIAITCFEEEHKSCHRQCVSEYLSNQLTISVSHL